MIIRTTNPGEEALLMNIADNYVPYNTRSVEIGRLYLPKDRAVYPDFTKDGFPRALYCELAEGEAGKEYLYQTTNYKYTSPIPEGVCGIFMRLPDESAAGNHFAMTESRLYYDESRTFEGIQEMLEEQLPAPDDYVKTISWMIDYLHKYNANAPFKFRTVWLPNAGGTGICATNGFVGDFSPTFIVQNGKLSAYNFSIFDSPDSMFNLLLLVRTRVIRVFGVPRALIRCKKIEYIPKDKR